MTVDNYFKFSVIIIMPDNNTCCVTSIIVRARLGNSLCCETRATITLTTRNIQALVSRAINNDRLPASRLSVPDKTRRSLFLYLISITSSSSCSECVSFNLFFYNTFKLSLSTLQDYFAIGP